MSTEVVETIFAKLKTLPPEQQREVLQFVEKLTDTNSKPATIWQEIREIVQDVPDEEWERLPRDGATNLDHYLYGAPKE